MVFKKVSKSGAINSTTRFKRFMFTLYDNLDSLHDTLTEYFELEECPFRYVKFQFERNYEGETDKPNKHAQGMVLLKERTRLGQFKGTKNSGIKKLFKSDKLHVDYINGT